MSLTVRAVQAYALGKPLAASTVRSITAYALVDTNPVVPGPPAPTDYKADQIDILYDLIEKSNPGFKAQYPKGTVQFSAVTAVPTVPGDGYKTDTSILVSPAPGSSALGRQTVRYRRIDFGTIFKHMTLTLNDYVASGTLPAATWKASFASKFGIKIPAADIANTTALTSGVLTNINVIATSWCYKGTVQLTWTVGPRPFTSIVTDANRALVGRFYPGNNNDFTTPGRKPQGEMLVYCQDASVISSFLEAFTSASVLASSHSTVINLVNWLLANTKRTDWNVGDSSSGSGGVTGLTWYRYTLPNAAIPDANSAKYNRCVVLQSVAGSWFAGKIIIHYNV
jgi:hypothetical protein